MALRAFVGLPVPPAPSLVELLEGLSRTGADLKVVDPAHLHVTLSFLGQVDDDAPQAIAPALDGAAGATKSFAVDLRSVGAFPNVRRPRVVWAGAEDPVPLTRLAASVRDALGAAGYAGDDKEFRAHVTLARTRSDSRIAGLVAFLREHGRDALGSFDVREVRLYRSAPTPKGPSYEVVHAASLEA